MNYTWHIFNSHVCYIYLGHCCCCSLYVCAISGYYYSCVMRAERRIHTNSVERERERESWAVMSWQDVGK